jgi:hypothetical protein
LLAGAVVTAKGHFVAEVFHRYVPSPVSAKQKVEKEAAAQRREAAKEALARSARRGWPVYGARKWRTSELSGWKGKCRSVFVVAN